MDNDIVHLKPLYDFVEKHLGDPSSLDGRSRIGRQYGTVCAECVGAVCAGQGFYLWGYFEENGLWRNVYLGKAGKGRTANLRSRILEELKDERWFVWRSFRSEQYLKGRSKEIYPNMWHEYEATVERAFLKRNAKYIAWVAGPNLGNEDILRVEADLIEALNPSANIRRPAPPSSLQDDSKRVFGMLRESIHKARPSQRGVRG